MLNVNEQHMIRANVGVATPLSTHNTVSFAKSLAIGHIHEILRWEFW